MPRVYYKCDPEKNVNCKKQECYVTNGRCSLTSKVEYTSNPDIAIMIFDVDPEDAKVLMQGDDT